MNRYGQDPTWFGVRRKLEARARRRRHSIGDGGAEKPVTVSETPRTHCCIRSDGKSVKAFFNSPSTLAEFRECLQALDTLLKRVGLDTFESHVFEYWGIRIPVEAMQPLKDLLQLKDLYPTASRTAETAMAAERLGLPSVITDFAGEWEKLKKVQDESVDSLLDSLREHKRIGAARRTDR